MGIASFLIFLHSLLRYGLLLFLVGSLFFAWRGYLLQRPILVGERMATIIAVVLAHVQLLVGLIIYMLRYKSFDRMSGIHERFWKFEHLGTMLVAIILITLGRALAKRAKEERRKQFLVGVFFLIALVLILWAIPWPHTELGHGREWI
ncbi:MAG: hypothetical protein R2810_03430 [Flavobacteriales bacterium]|nr:hypothetical protein [Flavobacteriales bacterium]MCB0782620.1 hypothetical protein [Flavobacteriales bacterium]MCB0810379.1 hypothetical protein [Flavobacteriales bacterium]MCB0812410.1 hypothetical protein [Flavobacteriales bacterium]